MNTKLRKSQVDSYNFSGNVATISPTAALNSAPTFSGDSLATHQHAAITGGTPAGTVTGEPLNLATPAFSGTGLSAVGQVITTTDNQTMLLNECAGMWLIPATGATPAVLILSNTAVNAAPAVLTVQGVAMTDAGTYSIVKSIAPTFTGSALATHQHAAITAGTPSGSNDAPAITVTGASYTPAGSIS